MKVKIGNYKSKGRGKRNINVEIEDFDTFDCFYTLSYIILPMLLQFKNNMHGVPNSFTQETASGQLSLFEETKEESDQWFEQNYLEWEKTVDKMIWSFQQILFDNYTDKYHHGKPNYNFLETKMKVTNPVTGKLEKTYELVDSNPNDHWYDYIGHELHDERIQEGLDLFAKYFRSLWN